jgi:hypothetical protein
MPRMFPFNTRFSKTTFLGMAIGILIVGIARAALSL